MERLKPAAVVAGSAADKRGCWRVPREDTRAIRTCHCDWKLHTRIVRCPPASDLAKNADNKKCIKELL